MSGIVSYGAYVPRYRVNRRVISSAMGFLGAGSQPGERSVCNHDEDALSMAVAAGINCLMGKERGVVDGLYLATVSQPYIIRQNSSIIATSLGMKPNIGTADFTSCTKSGTTALIAAFDATNRKKKTNILVCASDCRTGKPGGAQEQLYGDGSASFLVGDGEVVAAFKGHYSVSYDFPGRWQATRERFEHAWEDRFVRDEGYMKMVPQAISGLLGEQGLKVKDVSKVIYPCINIRDHAAIAKQLGFDSQQVQEPILETVGDTGSACPLMMLVAALETAKPGDNLVVASLGSGSDALLFRTTERIVEARDRHGMRRALAHRKDLVSYQKYLAFRNAMPVEVGIRGEEVFFSQMSLLWRDQKTIMSLIGSRCKACGTPQYPPQRICVNPDCGAVDQMEEYGFSDKKGIIFSYTGDNLAPSNDPPAMYGFVDFDGGGRFLFDVTDCELDELRVGLPVEMTFRRKYLDEARGHSGYYWKVKPAGQ